MPLKHFGSCLRYLNLTGYMKNDYVDSFALIKEGLSQNCENWIVFLSKLNDTIYYSTVSGTPPKIVANYFDKVSHKLNELEPGLIEKVLADYEKEILGGYGLKIASIAGPDIKEQLKKP